MTKYYSIVDLAEKLGLGTLRARQILKEAMKDEALRKQTKRGNRGRKLLLTPRLVDQVSQMYKSGKFGQPRPRTGKSGSQQTGPGSQYLNITASITDPFTAEVLLKNFGSVAEIEKYIVSVLEKTSEPAAQQLKKIKSTFEKEMSQLFRTGKTK